MAEDPAPTNGHRPTRRPRKRIYPPPEQMAAQRAAAASRPKPVKPAAPVATIEPDFGPEAFDRALLEFASRHRRFGR